MAGAQHEILKPGEWVHGRYQVVALLGRGGMGAVYRARDAQRNEDVALKVILPGADPSGSALLRFAREAEAVAKVDAHAGIVRVRELGRHAQLPFAVLDLVEGQDLSEVIAERGPLPLDEALRIVEQVARAIAHCHGRGVLHRDLKPANVLVRASDGVPFVSDFGLALDQEAERLTKSGQLLGTPAYMSPEQADGDRAAIDAHTDVYSLGALLYEALSGRPPFQGTQAEILKQVFLDVPQPPSARRPELPRDVDAICLRAMAKHKDARYPDATALADDLARLRAGEPIKARPPGWRELFRWRLRRRDRTALAQATLGGLILLAAVLAPVAYAVRFSAEDDAAARVARLLGAKLDAVLALDPLLEAAGARERQERFARDLARAFRPEAQEIPTAQAVAELATRVAELRGPRAGLLERFVRRVQVVDGLGAPQVPADSSHPEDRLMRALLLLRWRGGAQEPLTSAQVEQALALLDAKRPAHGRLLKLLKAARQASALYLEEGVTRVSFGARAVLGGSGASGLGGWPKDAAAFLRGQAGDALLGVALGELERGRAAASVRAVAAITSAYAAGDVAPIRWKQGPTYGLLAAWFEHVLGPFLGTSDGTPGLSAGVGKLLRVVASRADPQAGVPFSRLVSAMDPYLPTALHQETRRACGQILFQAFATGESLDARAFTLLPRFGKLPTRTGFYRQVVALPAFQRHVRRYPTGDGFLVWGNALRESAQRKQLARIEQSVQMFAKALGAHLTPKERRVLKVGAAVALRRPLSPEWVVFARARLADRFFDLEWARRGRVNRMPDLRVLVAAADIAWGARKQLDAFPHEGFQLEFLLGGALDFGSLAAMLQRRDQRESRRQWLRQMDMLDAGLPIAWAIHNEMVIEGQASACKRYGLDPWTTKESIRSKLLGFVRVKARRLQMEKRYGEERALLRKALSRIRRLERVLDLHLQRALAESYDIEGKYAEAEREAMKIVTEIKRRPGSMREGRKRAKHLDFARCRVVRTRHLQGKHAEAWAMYQEALTASSCTSRMWRAIVPLLKRPQRKQ